MKSSVSCKKAKNKGKDNMEILIGIVVVLVLVFIFGGIANNKPVQEWPDDKLLRMYLKLANAASLQTNLNKRSELYDKANEVSNEIRRRQKESPHFIESLTKKDPYVLNKLKQLGLMVEKEFSSDIEKLAEKNPDTLNLLNSLGIRDEIEGSGGIKSFIEEQRTIQNRVVQSLPNLFEELLKENISNGMEDNKAKENAKQRVLNKVLPYFERAKMDGMDVDEAINFVVKKFSN